MLDGLGAAYGFQMSAGAASSAFTTNAQRLEDGVLLDSGVAYAKSQLAAQDFTNRCGASSIRRTGKLVAH